MAVVVVVVMMTMTIELLRLLSLFAQVIFEIRAPKMNQNPKGDRGEESDLLRGQPVNERNEPPYIYNSTDYTAGNHCQIVAISRRDYYGGDVKICSVLSRFVKCPCLSNGKNDDTVVTAHSSGAL